MTTQQINISFSSAMADTIRIHTGETGRVIVFTPDILLEQDQSAEFIIVKPDNTFVIDDATIVNGLITVTMPEQAGAVSGVGGYILKVYKDSLCVYSASGPLMVDDHLLTDGMIESVAEAHGYVFPDDFLTDDDIEINPTSPSFATLTKIKYKGITYEVDGGAEDLNDLTDVTLTNPETGEVLTYDGQKWVNEALYIPDDLNDLIDVEITSPASGNVLQYDGQSWGNSNLDIPEDLEDLDDVAITSPAAGNVLAYNGAAWQNQNLTIPEDLDDLDDVEISAPEDGQQLVYNDGVWENQTITPVISKEASGNPIEITDGANAPLVKCVTQITGSQNLHGYDKPWVGGAGKNKFRTPYVGSSGTSGGITTTVNEDGSVTFVGMSTGDVYWSFRTGRDPLVLSAGTYTVSINNMPSYCALYFGSTYLNNSNLSRVITISEDTEYDAYIQIPSSAGTVNFTLKVQVESGSSSTAWKPYSNICPITAYTDGEIEVSSGADVYSTNGLTGYQANSKVEIISDKAVRCYTTQAGTYMSANQLISPFSLTIGKTYTLECDVTVTSGVGALAIRNPSYNAIVITDNITQSGHYKLTFEMQSNAYFIAFFSTMNTSVNGDVTYSHIRLYEGTERTTHTISLGGTYYSGHIDAVRGVLVADKGYYELPSTGWIQEGDYTGVYASYAFGVSNTYPQLICSVATRGTSYSNVINNNGKIGISASRIIWHESSFATASDLMTYLSNNVVQIVYDLATPLEIPVTPTNLPIKSLFGYNHIESSTGDMEVEYITETYEPIIKALEQLIPANTRSIQSPIQNTIEETPQEIKKIVPEDEKEVGEEDAILRLTDEEGGEENADQRLTDE